MVFSQPKLRMPAVANFSLRTGSGHAHGGYHFNHNVSFFAKAFPNLEKLDLDIAESLESFALLSDLGRSGKFKFWLSRGSLGTHVAAKTAFGPAGMRNN